MKTPRTFNKQKYKQITNWNPLKSNKALNPWQKRRNKKNTLHPWSPKFKIASEKWCLEDCIPCFWVANFQGRTVKLPVSKFSIFRDKKRSETPEPVTWTSENNTINLRIWSLVFGVPMWPWSSDAPQGTLDHDWIPLCLQASQIKSRWGCLFILHHQIKKPFWAAF